VNSRTLLATMAMLTAVGSYSLLAGGQISDPYLAGILAQRKARDEAFRSRDWSALAVVAITRLDRPRITIGSAENSDLRLTGDEIRPVHAEIARSGETGAKPVFTIRALDGEVLTASNPTNTVREATMPAGTRFRIGRALVYQDNLGTLGAVLRALDYSTPAYTLFNGLSYFPPDPAWRVEANVTPYPKPEETIIGDTQGWQRTAWKYGEASFVLGGEKRKLVLLLLEPDPGPQSSFFLAFSDETRGKETYSAARYLNPKFVSSGLMVIDFNLAENPLCAYNAGFACPLPPRENRLPVEIRAGEKTYPHASGVAPR
jgi:uncharacterized protein (DUF1684 family)